MEPSPLPVAENLASATRWYRPTPGRLLGVLLGVDGLLLLSQRFQWFSFNENKGWTALIAVAGLLATMALMLLWFVLALCFRWRFQFSVRSLLVLAVVVAIPCSWMAVEMKQKRAVDAIKREGGRVQYDLPVPPPPGLISYGSSTLWLREWAWLHDLLGEDFFGTANLVSYRDNSAAGSVADVSFERLAELPQVQTLELGRNRVTDAGWNRLRTLTQIRTLHFFGSVGITDEKLECLEGMRQLTTLSLSSPAITDGGLERLQKFHELQCLNLDGTAITDAGLAHLQRLPQLRRLSLANTKITGIGLARLQGMNNLGEICLSGSSFTDAGVANLRRLPNIQHLLLIDPLLTDAEVKRVKGLPSLQYLFLSGPQITDSALAYLRDLPQLETLVLHAKQVTDKGLANFRGMRQLHHLYIPTSKVTLTGIKSLQRARPDLKVQNQ